MQIDHSDKIISGNNPNSGKDPQFRFFHVIKGETKVSLETAGSPLPSAQNTPQTEVAYFGATCPKPLHVHAAA